MADGDLELWLWRGCRRRREGGCEIDPLLHHFFSSDLQMEQFATTYLLHVAVHKGSSRTSSCQARIEKGQLLLRIIIGPCACNHLMATCYEVCATDPLCQVTRGLNLWKSK